jgi:uncharacterized protein YhjY with autotransporter beta-barrel domain
MRHRLLSLSCLVLALCVFPATVAEEPTPPDQTLDALWTTICPGAAPGSTFETRCNEILLAGPGSGARSSAAAQGNNLDTLAAQVRVARDRKPDNKVIGGKAWSFYATGAVQRSDWEGSARENGYDTDGLDLVLGADWTLSDGMVWGANLTRTTADTTFDESAGDLDLDTYALTTYLNWRIGEQQGLDLYAGYGTSDYTIARNVGYTLILNAGTPLESTTTIAGRTAAETDGSQILAGAAWSWDLTDGAAWLGPTARADYVDADVDGYEESGGAGLSMRFRDRSAKSLRGEAGIVASRPFSQGWGVLSAQGTATAVHEFQDDPRSVVASFRGDLGNTAIPLFLQEPDRDFFRVGAALSAIMKNGWIVFAQVETLLGHTYESRERVALGVRWER